MSDNQPAVAEDDVSSPPADVATMLFVDQVGSTRLLAELGDEAMVAIRGDLWSMFTRVVAEHGGRVLSDEGDGGSALFELANDAAAAGLAMLAATADRDDLVLRAGCNTGPVLPTATGMVGLAIHLAARVCDAAPARHLAASEATVEALRQDSAAVRYTNFGRRNMKGLPTPVALTIVTGVDDPALDVVGIERVESSPLLEETVDATAFVGRVAEIVQLHRALFPPRSDQPRLVLLAGDAGSGKTALAYHVARELSEDGVLCLIGRSDEALDDPFFEIIEMLRPVARSLPVDDVSAHIERHGTIVARLLPELLDRVEAEHPGDDDAAPDRQHLFDAIGDLLAVLSDRQPLVLLFEDLHWASAQTLDLLRSLLRSSRLLGTSLLFTLRPQAGELNSAATEFVHWLAASHHAARIDLGPLDRTEVAGLCQTLLGVIDRDALDVLLGYLMDQTAGNALFCTELLRSFRDGSSVTSGAAIDLDALSTMPSTVQELALARVRKLGADVADVLTDAAVLGESFDLAELRAMSGGDAVEGLDLAERVGLVRPDDTGGRRFTFGHALVQQALYRQLTTIGRMRRHRAAADAMSSRPGSGNVFERLHHLRSAGSLADPMEIIEAAGAAASEASGKLALADAVQFRQLAVDQSIAAGIDQRELAVALAALGRAQTANALQVGKATMVEASAAAHAAGDWDLVADIAIAYGGELKENQAPPDVSEPVELITRALDHHRAPTARRARLLSAVGVWQRQHRPYTERLAAVDEALDIARALGDQRTLAMILSERHRALHGPNAVAEALDASYELESLAAELGSDALDFQAMYLRVIGAMELGDWDVATAHADRLISAGAKLQNVEGRRLQAMWRNIDAQVRGDWEESRRHVEELMAIIADYPKADIERLFGATSFVPCGSSMARRSSSRSPVPPAVEHRPGPGSRPRPARSTLRGRVSPRHHRWPISKRASTTCGGTMRCHSLVPPQPGRLRTCRRSLPDHAPVPFVECDDGIRHVPGGRRTPPGHTRHHAGAGR
ncbi:MAG: AAA family ATPase [Acidimicrobiales bacterium]